MYIKPIHFWAVIIAHPLPYLCLLFVKDLIGEGKRGQEEGQREEIKKMAQKQAKTTNQEQLIINRLYSQQIGKKANPKIQVGVFRRLNKQFLSFKCFQLHDKRM